MLCNMPWRSKVHGNPDINGVMRRRENLKCSIIFVVVKYVLWFLKSKIFKYEKAHLTWQQDPCNIWIFLQMNFHLFGSSLFLIYLYLLLILIIYDCSQGEKLHFLSTKSFFFSFFWMNSIQVAILSHISSSKTDEWWGIKVIKSSKN